jgi:hypothetical protein
MNALGNGFDPGGNYSIFIPARVFGSFAARDSPRSGQRLPDRGIHPDRAGWVDLVCEKRRNGKAPVSVLCPSVRWFARCEAMA